MTLFNKHTPWDTKPLLVTVAYNEGPQISTTHPATVTGWGSNLTYAMFIIAKTSGTFFVCARIQ